VSFQEAVTTVLTQKYADFSGRARRSEYWFFALAAIIAAVVVAIIDSIIGTQIPYIILVLALIVPGIAVTVRRLHDTGHSGWWYLLVFVPFGGFVLLYWSVLDSDPTPNQYGPSPKGASAAQPTQWG